MAALQVQTIWYAFLLHRLQDDAFDAICLVLLVKLNTQATLKPWFVGQNENIILIYF